MNNAPPPPREYSPDGKWVWDGEEWQPDPGLVAPARSTSPYGTSTSWSAQEGADLLEARPAIAPPRSPTATHTLPRPKAAPPVSMRSVHNRHAWVLAFTPLIALVVDIVCALEGIGSGSTIIVGGIVVALLAGVYLFVRASRLHNGFAIPLTWCGAFAFFVGGLLVMPQALGVPIDGDDVALTITNEFQERAGLSLVVACPSRIWVRPGEAFSCTATATDGSQLTIDVTVRNTQGDVTWDVRAGSAAPK